MKNVYIFTILVILSILSMTTISAQCDSEEPIAVDNAGMENWVDEGNYEDPAGDFWDTANRTVDLLPLILNPNVTKSTDAHTGTYSAKLTTSNWFGLTSSATVFSGVFEPNQANPQESVKFGKPFTLRPDNFRVWYKYEPVNGDSAELYTYLTKWNTTTNMKDTIAEAYAVVYDPTDWVELDIPFDYWSSLDPDSISIVFASSAAGDFFEGQVGNTLYIDDVELYYCLTGISQPLMSEISAVVSPNPSITGSIRFDLNKEVQNGLLRVFSLDGKAIFSQSFSGNSYDLNIDNWTSAMYRYVIYDEKTTSALATGSFIKE